MWHNKAVSAPALSTVLGFLYGHAPSWESVASLVHSDYEEYE
jgi:hypothetical protein